MIKRATIFSILILCLSTLTFAQQDKSKRPSPPAQARPFTSTIPAHGRRAARFTVGWSLMDRFGGRARMKPPRW